MISRSAYEYVRAVMAETAGVRFPNNTDYLVESRLLPYARSHGIDSVNEFIRLAQAGRIDSSTELFVEALTDKETSFFRDIYPFEVLRRIILPELRTKRASERKLAIWSAGCSTGQEPYSISLLLHESLPDHASWDLQIVACDISREALRVAEDGRYNQLEVNRGLALPLLVKYFEKNGIHWQLKQPIREQVTFQRLNLIEPWPDLGTFDLILMRNVLSGFAPELQRHIIQNLLNHLQPDGYLIVGSKETAEGINSSFDEVRVEKAVCHRPKQGRTARVGTSPGTVGAAQAESAASAWRKVAQLALNPGAVNPSKVIELCATDDSLSRRCLAVAAADPANRSKSIRSIDAAAACLRKEQLFLSAASFPAFSALTETLGAMTSTERVWSDIAPVELKDSNQFTGTISYIGHAYGMISITMTETFANELVSQALGLSPEEAGRETTIELLNQALNLIGTNLKASFENAGFKWEQKSAFVAASGRRKLELPPWAARSEFAIQSGDQVLVVEMIVTSLEPAFTNA